MLGVGVVVLYAADLQGPLLLLATCVAATVGIAAAGATVLFASHELDRAEGLATRAVTIAGGQIRDDSGAGPIGVERAG